MPSVLGKRKARSAEPKEALATPEELHDIFRRHFEAQFAPLDVADAPPNDDETDDEDGDEADATSEWDGLSDEDDDAARVQVVDHSAATSTTSTTAMSKRDLRAFMSSRPPETTTAAPSTTPSKRPLPDDEEEDSASLLANDLALQRLLSESHLLSRTGLNPFASASSSTSTPVSTARNHHAPEVPAAQPFTQGRTRARAQDLRIQALARQQPLAKAPRSLYAQAKIPMALRKTQAANAAARESKRRREARENGVVLERHGGGAAALDKARKQRRRPGGGGVDLPSIGRMRGAELRISKRDIQEMEGGRGGGGAAGGGRRGRDGAGRGKTKSGKRGKR